MATELLPAGQLLWQGAATASIVPQSVRGLKGLVDARCATQFLLTRTGCSEDICEHLSDSVKISISVHSANYFYKL